MPEQVIIEFIGDTTQLQPAVKQLTQIGNITEDQAKTFTDLGQSGKAAANVITESTKGTVKTFDDLGGSMNRVAKSTLGKVFDEISKSITGTNNLSTKLIANLGKQAVATKGATVAQQGLNVAMLENPIGAIVVVLAALVGLYEAYEHTIGSTTDAEKRQALASAAAWEAHKKATEAIGEETGQLTIWLETAKASTLSYRDRQDAIDQIRKAYPEYLSNLSQENIMTGAISDSIDRQIKLIRIRAEQQASADVYKEKLKAVAEAQNEYNRVLTTGGTVTERFTASVKDFGNWYTTLTPRQQLVNEKQRELNAATMDADESLKNFKGTLRDTFDSGSEYVQGLIDKFAVFKKEVQTAYDPKQFESDKKLTLAATQFRVDTAKKGSQEEYDARKALAYASYYYDVTQAGKTADDKKIAEYKYNAEIFKIRQDSLNAGHALEEKSIRAVYDMRVRAAKDEADLFNSIVTDKNNPYALRLAFLQNYVDASVALLNKQMQAELNTGEKTGAERANIEDKYERQINAIVLQAGITRIKLQEGINNDLKKQAEKFHADLDAQSEAIATKTIESVNAIYAAINSRNDADRVAELGALNKSFEDGLISFESYQKKKQDISDRYALMDLHNQQAELQAEIGNLEYQYDNKLITETTFNEKIKGLREQLTKVSGDIYEADAKNFKDSTDDKKKALESLRASFEYTAEGLKSIADDFTGKLGGIFLQLYDTLQKIGEDKSLTQQEKNLKSIAAAFQSVQEAANDLFSSQAKQRSDELDAEISHLETLKEAELNNVGITEFQKGEIQKRYAKQESDLKNKAAQTQRKADVAQALVNGFLAVGNALATVRPFIPNALIAAGIAASLAGVQAALIKSRPLPQFAKGTKRAPRGKAWVGEEGPEIIDLKGGEQIFTAHESKRIEKAWEAEPRVPGNLATVQPSINGGHSIDYNKLGGVIASQAARMSVTADENGFTTFITKNQSRTVIRNKRYKF